MPCRTVELPNGARAIVCARGARSYVKPCCVIGCRRSATLLCDADLPARGGKPCTCDAPMCTEHALEIGPDRHVCPRHRNAIPPAQDSLL